jgi:hypothetical protein
MQTEKALVKERYLTKPRINIRYPFFYGIDDWFVESKINQVIFKELLSILDEQNYECSDKEFLGTFQLKVNQKSIVSLILKVFSFSRGTTDEITVMRSLTFNLKTGKKYNLEELFKPVYLYKQQLSNYIQQDIHKNNIPLLEPFKSIKEKQGYYLTPSYLVIYFQQYEYIPKASGFLKIPISYYNIEEMINKDSAIGLLFKK